MDLSYCNGQKRYYFSTETGFYYPGCNLMYFHISDLSPKAFRRGYVAALFAEDKRWLIAIEKYQMVMPGSPKNSRDKARDLGDKEHLQDQISSRTYEDRKRFYEEWRQAPCCVDDCDRPCADDCNGIKFKSTPTYGLDSDVRRYITKYGRYETASEREEINDREVSNLTVLSEVRDRKSNDAIVRVRGQEGDGLLGPTEEVASDQAERIEEMLLHPRSGGMVT